MDSEEIGKLVEAIGAPQTVAAQIVGVLDDPGSYSGADRGIDPHNTPGIGLFAFLDAAQDVDRCYEFDYKDEPMTVFYYLARLIDMWSYEGAEALRDLEVDESYDPTEAIDTANKSVAMFGLVFIEIDINSDSHPVVACRRDDDSTVRSAIEQLTA